MANFETWSGKTAYDTEGNKIGTIADLYVDEENGDPTWATVKSGLFGSRHHFVPLKGATETDEGVRFDTTEDKVKNAPNIENDGELNEGEQRELYTYYAYDSGRNHADGPEDADGEASAGAAAGTAGGGNGVDDTDTDADAGHNVGGQTTDNAMTRSEEELVVGKHSQESGRYRLKKYVVTENVTKTVPVSREEVRVEREPITGDNVDAATDGPAISEEEHEVVTHEEVPDVDKVAVPKERVSLGKETVSDERQVNGEVRKERVDLEKDE